MKVKQFAPRTPNKLAGTITSMQQDINMIVRMLDDRDREIAQLLRVVEELNVRVLYLLHGVKTEQRSLIIGAQPQFVTFFDAYMHGDRDRFLNAMKEKYGVPNLPPHGGGEASNGTGTDEHESTGTDGLAGTAPPSATAPIAP